MKRVFHFENASEEIVSLTLLGGTPSISSTGLITSGISSTVASAASLAAGIFPLTLVPAFADSLLGQASNRFLSLGMSHSTWHESDWGKGLNEHTYRAIDQQLRPFYSGSRNVRYCSKDDGTPRGSNKWLAWQHRDTFNLKYLVDDLVGVRIV